MMLMIFLVASLETDVALKRGYFVMKTGSSPWVNNLLFSCHLLSLRSYSQRGDLFHFALASVTDLKPSFIPIHLFEAKQCQSRANPLHYYSSYQWIWENKRYKNIIVCSAHVPLAQVRVCLYSMYVTFPKVCCCLLSISVLIACPH